MRITAARYAAVTATLALAVALGGSAYAATLIGTKNIKNGAVTSPKIAKKAVTSPKIANDAVTGAKVQEGTLSTVPNAARVGSNTVDDLRLVAGTNTAPRVIFERVGLRVSAGCSGGNPSLPLLTATTTVAGSSVYTVVHGDGTPAAESPLEADLESGDFGPSNTFDLLAGSPGNVGLVTFDFLSAGGKIVSGHVVTDSFGSGCTVTGFAISDS